MNACPGILRQFFAESVYASFGEFQFITTGCIQRCCDPVIRLGTFIVGEYCQSFYIRTICYIRDILSSVFVNFSMKTNKTRQSQSISWPQSRTTDYWQERGKKSRFHLNLTSKKGIPQRVFNLHCDTPLYVRQQKTLARNIDEYFIIIPSVSCNITLAYCGHSPNVILFCLIH